MRPPAPSAVALVAIAVLAPAAPASGAGWQAPREVASAPTLFTLPRAEVDDTGRVHVLYGGVGLGLATLDRGATRARRRLVTRRGTSATWDVGPRGHVLVAWIPSPLSDPPILRARTAAPGRRLTRARTIAGRRGGVRPGPAAVSRRGTAAVTWEQAGGRVGLASGPAGGRLRQRRPARGRGVWAQHLGAVFDARERLVVSWLRTGGRAGRVPHYSLRTAPGATRPGRPRFTGSSPRSSSVGLPRIVTDARGGQVAAWGDMARGGVVVAARRPGRRLGRSRLLRTSPDIALYGASNAAGDAVFAWRDGMYDVYAFVRRRDGRIVGPSRLSHPDPHVTARQPAVAIDGAGRAVVAWEAKHGPPSQQVASVIEVAVSNRAGRFRPRVALDDGSHVDSDPSVAANARGDVAVTWMRHLQSEQRAMVARARLGR